MDAKRFAPLILAGAIGLLTLIVAPEIVSGTFSDLDTFARSAAFTGGLVLWFLLARRFVPHEGAGWVIALVPVLIGLWVVLWPYIRPATEVDEAFPISANPADVEQTTTTTPPPTTVPPTTTLPPSTTLSLSTTPAPSEPSDSAPPTTSTSTSTTTTTTTTATSTTTVAPEPVELARSSFQGLTGHRGSGDAAVYRLADGSILLRFEEVDIGSGPDLEVYVVPGEDQRGLSGGTHVAGLTAERGNQNYFPPESVDLTSGTWTVLVWCETFAVEVANATFTA
ncbi:MAG: DM13 domain-containing protein [Actinomycetota bacterium]